MALNRVALRRAADSTWRAIRALGWPEWLFMAAFAASAIYSVTPIISGDSGGYIPAGRSFTDPLRAVAPGDIATWGAVSFTGDSFRAWPATLFYALFPGGDGLAGMGGRVLVQWVLAMLATVYFARALTGRGLLGRAAVPLRVFVYLMALSATTITHAVTIGAEGPSYVIALIAVGLLLNVLWRVRDAAWTRRDSLCATLAMTLAVILAVARFTGVVLVVAFAGVLIWLLVRRVPSAGLRSARNVGLAALVVGTVVGLAYVMSVSSHQSAAWKPTSERAYRVFFAVSPQLNPRFAADYAAALPDDAPKCLTRFDPTIRDWSALGKYGPEVCGASGLRWIEDNYTRVTLHYWLTNPGSAKAWAVQGAAYASSPWTYPGTRSVVPSVVNAVYFTSDGTRDNVALFWFLAPLGGLVLVVMLAWRRRRAPGSPDRDAQPAGPFVALALTAWLAFVLSYMDIWDSHPRKAWPFYFVALTLGVAAFVIAVREWRRTGAAGASGD